LEQKCPAHEPVADHSGVAVAADQSFIITPLPRMVSCAIALQMLGGVSTKTVYRLLKKGEIKSKFIGKRYVIPKLYVIEYITRQQQ
jgi:excisionase family DNA binding protein